MKIPQSSLDNVYAFFLETELSVSHEVFLHCKRMHIGKIVKQNNKHKAFSIQSISRVICTLSFLGNLWIFVLDYKITKSDSSKSGGG